MATSVHGINFNVGTTAKAPVLAWFRFTVGGSGAVGTVKQCRSQSVDTITRSGFGTYTVQFNKPYPLNVVFFDLEIAAVAQTTALRFARYTAGSYNASTGQLAFTVCDNASAAAEAVQNTEIQAAFVYQHMNALKD